MAKDGVVETRHLEGIGRASSPTIVPVPKLAAMPAPLATREDADPGNVRDQMRDLERQRILEALEKCAGNQSRAAQLLGMPRRTLVKRLDAYGIARPRKKDEESR
jgi:two-component system, NtrC family, response regulator AtoC